MCGYQWTTYNWGTQVKKIVMALIVQVINLDTINNSMYNMWELLCHHIFHWGKEVLLQLSWYPPIFISHSYLWTRVQISILRITGCHHLSWTIHWKRNESIVSNKSHIYVRICWFIKGFYVNGYELVGINQWLLHASYKP